MMFNYRGRKIRIEDQKLADYKYVTGYDLVEENIDIYVHNEFIRTNPEPLSLVPSLSDEELENIVLDGMNLEISAGFDVD